MKKSNIEQILRIGEHEIIKGLCTVNYLIRVFFKSGATSVELSNHSECGEGITHSALYKLIEDSEDVEIRTCDKSIIIYMGNGIKIIAWKQ